MAFSPDSDVVVINEAGAFSARVAQRVGRGRVKARRTIEIVSEPLLHDFDANMLGAKPAEAIRAALSNAIKGITAIASTATLKKREAAERAFNRGEPWALRRYAGGRTGPTPPNQTPRLFNDSGRFANGLFVRQNPTDATYTVNVPANRLDPAEFAAGRFEAMLNKLRELVPALGDVRKLLTDEKVRAAINESIRDLITKGDSRNEAKLKQLAAARKRAVLALVRAFQQVAF